MVVVILGVAGGWAYRQLPWFANLVHGAGNLVQTASKLGHNGEIQASSWLSRLLGGRIDPVGFTAPDDEAILNPISTPPLKLMSPCNSDLGSTLHIAQIENQRDWDQLPVGGYFYDGDGEIKNAPTSPESPPLGAAAGCIPYSIGTDQELAQLKPGDWYLDCRIPYIPDDGLPGSKLHPYDVWDDKYLKRIPRGAWYVDERRPGHQKYPQELVQKDSD